MWKKLLVVAIVVGAIVAIPMLVLAYGNSSRLDHQTARVRAKPASTSSKTWQDVPGMRGLRVCALREVSATVSVNVSGAPVRFRVQIDDGGHLFPGKTEFDPRGGTKGFSFTFEGAAVSFEGIDEHVYDVQWRSVTGGAVMLHGGVFNVLYQDGSHC